MAIDTVAIKEHIKGIHLALGENPEREGLKDTPLRVARMYEEVFEGMKYSNHEIARMFNKTFKEDLALESENKDLILVKEIDACHSCVSCRGVKKTSAKTHTSTLRGLFQTDASLQQRLNN